MKIMSHENFPHTVCCILSACTPTFTYTVDLLWISLKKGFQGLKDSRYFTAVTTFGKCYAEEETHVNFTCKHECMHA